MCASDKLNVYEAKQRDRKKVERFDNWHAEWVGNSRFDRLLHALVVCIYILTIVLVVRCVFRLCMRKRFLTNPHKLFFSSSSSSSTTLSFHEFFFHCLHFFISLYHAHTFFPFFSFTTRRCGILSLCLCVCVYIEMRVGVLRDFSFLFSFTLSVFGAPTFNAHPYVQLNVFVCTIQLWAQINFDKIVHRLCCDSVLA